MKKTLLTKLSIIFLVFLISCAPSAPLTAITTKDIEPSATLTAVSPPQPTATVVTATPSPTPLPVVKTQCVNNAQETRSLDLQGVLALGNAIKALGSNFGFYLFDLNNTRVIKTIPGGLSNEVSPDGKYLAYEHYDSSNIQDYIGLLDSNGNLVNDFAFFFDGRWQNYYNWQNPNQLRIAAKSNEDKLIVHLLNPFTKEYSPLRTDWDGIYKPENSNQQSQHVNWKFDQNSKYNVYGANILYDPTLTRVVYPKEDGTVSLVDVKTEQELARAHFMDWGLLPVWSSNGEYLTILNHEDNADEFYLVSKDGGEFQQITNFSAEFGQALVADYSWSPDSKRIAFWLNLETKELKDGAQSELAILDIPSGQVTRLCIQGISTNAYEPWTMNHSEPVWSPDGRYIVITQWDDPTAPKNYDILVIDTQTGLTEKISENTAPIGWMTKDQ